MDGEWVEVAQVELRDGGNEKKTREHTASARTHTHTHKCETDSRSGKFTPRNNPLCRLAVSMSPGSFSPSRSHRLPHSTHTTSARNLMISHTALVCLCVCVQV